MIAPSLCKTAKGRTHLQRSFLLLRDLHLRSDERHFIALTAPFCLANGTHGFPAFVEEHGHCADGMNYVHRATLFIVADVFAQHTKLFAGDLFPTSKYSRDCVNGGRLCRPHISPAPRTQCSAIGEVQTMATTRS